MGSYLLKDCVFEYLCDLGKIKQKQIIIDNIKSSLSNHLNGQKTTPIVMAKDIVYALATLFLLRLVVLDRLFEFSVWIAKI
jgi:hypothetical protein